MDPRTLLEYLPVSQLGFGGLAGMAAGYAAKKLARLTAIAIGLAFIGLQILAYNGLITINWGAMETTAHGLWQSPEGVTLAERVWTILAGNLPFGVAFASSFAIGFKLG